MKKRLQVVLHDDSWCAVESFTHAANEGFENGSITFSDVINEMVLHSNVDIKTLQAKHTNLRKSLRQLASKKELDVDLAIESLMTIKNSMKSKGKKIRKPERQECLSV